MSESAGVPDSVTVDAENIGGIDRSTVEFEPGVTILAGRNATNRTSLLQAIMVGHGSDRTPLKADATDGCVTIDVGGDHYERALSRENGAVKAVGTSYVNESPVADLFAFLLGDNEARRVIERGDDPREVIMRPVDTDEIQAEIRELRNEKQRLDEEIADLESLETKLPDLEQERTRLAGQIETKRSELEAKRTELEKADASVDEKRQTREKLEAKLEDLRDVQSDLETVRHDLRTQRETLESLREERADRKSEFEALPEAPETEIERLEDRLQDLHDRRQSLTADLNRLGNVIQFNEEMLDDADAGLFADLADDRSQDGSITDRLVDGASVTCWTCGSSVQRDGIEETVDDLREFRQRKLQERRDVEAEFDDCQSRKQELETQREQREQLERALEEYETKIAETEARIDDLEAERERLSERETDLSEAVEKLEQEEHSELLERHSELNQLEFEVESLEDDLADVEAEIESIESRLEERDELENRRETVQDEIEDLRTKVERIEQEAVDAFNTHMDQLLEELEYENIERVWIERVEREVREGRRKATKSAFELHVVRETDDGTVFEDTVDHLSESEREVVGLVFSLAGYLVHDVHESVPFMLLDSLEAIDADRIATLVDYFSEYADYLVVALLPEDAAALDESYRRITDI